MLIPRGKSWLMNLKCIYLADTPIQKKHTFDFAKKKNSVRNGTRMLLKFLQINPVKLSKR